MRMSCALVTFQLSTTASPAAAMPDLSALKLTNTGASAALTSFSRVSCPPRSFLTTSFKRTAPDASPGSTVEAELLLSGERHGLVVPLSALNDDSGTTVAYVQLEGERFARREVRVVARLGNEALVEGLRPGERLVTQGGGAVRRASLLSAGAPEGHVH